MKDEFQYHEVLDRLSIIRSILSDFVEMAPLMDDEAELLKLVVEAEDKLSEAYQLAGRLRFGKFPDSQPKLVLALPAYEKRRIVVASDELIDGERLVCVAIKDAP